MQVLQWTFKIDDYYGTLYVSITMNVKNQQLLWDLICEYYNEYKKLAIIMGSYMWVLQWI